MQPAKIAVIRIDLDKNSSSLAALDGNGTVVKRRHVIVTGAAHRAIPADRARVRARERA